jgi:hypothetical protein
VDEAGALPPIMTNERFRGDLLFLLGVPAGGAPEDLRVRSSAQADLSADEAVTLPYSVLHFSANRLNLSVDNSAGAGWLEYADVWHSSWRASVNGRQVPVYRANMAYKAIPLQPGPNVIEFAFGSRTIPLLARLIGICSALWLVFIPWMAYSSLGTPARVGHEFR